MRNIYRLLIILLLGDIGYANAQDSVNIDMSKMKTYYFVLLSTGTSRNQDSATVNKIQNGHMANIRRLVKEGKLIVAGPFLDEGNLRGIFIFDAKSKEEVVELLKSDPAIASRRLNYEIHPWMTQKGTVFN